MKFTPSHTKKDGGDAAKNKNPKNVASPFKLKNNTKPRQATTTKKSNKQGNHSSLATLLSLTISFYRMKSQKSNLSLHKWCHLDIHELGTEKFSFLFQTLVNRHVIFVTVY